MWRLYNVCILRFPNILAVNRRLRQMVQVDDCVFHFELLPWCSVILDHPYLLLDILLIVNYAIKVNIWRADGVNRDLMVTNAVAESVNGDFRPSNRNMPKTRFIPVYKFSVEMHFILVKINLLYLANKVFGYIGITLSVCLSVCPYIM